MLKKCLKMFVLGSLLGALLSGLCASAQTNTTPPDTAASSHPIQKPDVTPTPPKPPLIRMALLLPLNSVGLSSAAEAVRDGFFAAFDRDNTNVTVTTFKTGELPQDVVPIYLDAASQNDIVVGPLSRDDVAAVAQNGKVSVPTIALAHPEGAGDGEVIYPQKMLMMGLSAEEEARQLANTASAGKKKGQAFILSTAVPWQRRAAKAFAEGWQRHGLTQQSIEIPVFEGYFKATSLAQLTARIQAEKPAVIFVALDAVQTSQLRVVLGNDAPIYGTSQLNALTLSDRQTSAPVPEMDGVSLVDIPWQLQPDHLAVMSYPPLPAKDKQKNSADLERLYALGIDAYRVAKEIASQRSNFTIDGVTGALTISFGKGAPSFNRVEQPATYRQGNLVPLNITQ